MTRLKRHFDASSDKRALIAFVTAGDPTLAHTVPAMHALVAGGVDIIELGIPFSDPEAEGPTIQASSERALANGVTLRAVLEMVTQFRRENANTPVVLMGYLNSILAMADFPQRAQAAGVDGLIVVNLPPEEAGELQAELVARDIDLIFLLAPTTTDARAQYILSAASGFAYYVSLKGITGADHLVVEPVAERLRELRRMSDLPICVGFGIKDPQTAAAIAPHASGVVVGSALVNLMAAHADDVGQSSEALQAAAHALRQGVDSST